MKELISYTEFIKRIIDTYYLKENVFYDNGEWYSRYHSRKITIEELTEWAWELISPTLYEED